MWYFHNPLIGYFKYNQDDAVHRELFKLLTRDAPLMPHELDHASDLMERAGIPAVSPENLTILDQRLETVIKPSVAENVYH